MTLKETYFRLYDQLPEPYRSLAKDNLEPSAAQSQPETPKTLLHALYDGFVWSDTDEGHAYWSDVARRAEAGEFDPVKHDITDCDNKPLTTPYQNLYEGGFTQCPPQKGSGNVKIIQLDGVDVIVVRSGCRINVETVYSDDNADGNLITLDMCIVDVAKRYLSDFNERTAKAFL